MVDVVCREVDDVQLDRLFTGDRDGLAHGLLGPFGVAPAMIGDAANVGRGVVGDFFVQVAFDVAAAARDRVRCADLGVGGHRCDVSGHGDERPRRRGARARRADEHDDGNLCGEDALDDVVGRRDQSAGRVHHQDPGGGVLIFGAIEGALDEAGGDGSDLLRHARDMHRAGRIAGAAAAEQQRPQPQRQDRQAQQSDWMAGQISHAPIIRMRDKLRTCRHWCPT